MHASKTKIIIKCSASTAFAAAHALKLRDLDLFFGSCYVYQIVEDLCAFEKTVFFRSNTVVNVS